MMLLRVRQPWFACGLDRHCYSLAIRNQYSILYLAGHRTTLDLASLAYTRSDASRTTGLLYIVLHGINLIPFLYSNNWGCQMDSVAKICGFGA